MDEAGSDLDRLNALAHQFAERCRNGSQPTVDEYAERYPEMAEQIRDLFPTLAVLERAGSSSGRSDIPSQLGEFRIVRQIGRGGMGTVYEAIQESLGRRVALKVLTLPETSGSELDRFQREARAAAKLHHTNIVPVFAVGMDQGFYYYAMQYIEGQNLDAVLREVRRHRLMRYGDRHAGYGLSSPPATEPLAPSHDVGAVTTVRPEVVESTAPTAVSRPPSKPSFHAEPRVGLLLNDGPRDQYYLDVARIGGQAAQALAFAHEQQILHRDIKPSNLMLDNHGTLWLSDFGLARVEGLAELTMPQDLVGTLLYMPPERFRGQSDARGDIYSLGLTLYEALALRPAFHAKTRAELMELILNSSPATLRSFDRQIPRDLETIVLKAVARQPEQRYQTAAAMAEDLKRFLTDRPILARRASIPECAWRWCHANPALATLTVATAVLLVVIALGSFLASLRLNDQLAQTRFAQRQSRERRVATLLAQSQALRHTQRSGQRFKTLDVLEEAKQIAEGLALPRETFNALRNETIAALCLADLELSEELEVGLASAVMVDLDPKFQQYARGGDDGSVTIHRVLDGRRLHRLDSPRPGLRVADYLGVVYSPDGRYLQQLCYGTDGRKGYLRLWDLQGKRPRLTLDLPGGVLWSAFSPNSAQIAVNRMAVFGTVDTSPQHPAVSVHVYDLATGSECVPSFAANESARLAFHPIEFQLAVSDDTGVRIVDVETGVDLARWDRPQTSWLEWTRDGCQLLAASDSDLLIQRWDVRQNKSLSPLAGHNTGGFVMTVDPGGHMLASIDWSGMLRLWDLRAGQLLLATPAGEFTTSLRFRDDGELLGGPRGSSGLRLFRVASGGVLQRFALEARFDAGFPRAVLSPDGRLLAATARDATVIVDVQRGEQVASIPGARRPLCFASTQSLLTHANLPEGLTRWSLPVDVDLPDRIEVEPRRPLTIRQANHESSATVGLGGLDHWAASVDGRVIAMPNYDRGANLLISRDGQNQPSTGEYQLLELAPQRDVRACAVSPDGRWAVTGSHSAGTVTVWDVGTGMKLRDLMSLPGIPGFSPDGQWLYVTSSGIRFWNVDSWQAGPAIDATFVAFDHQSQLMAVDSDYGVIKLLGCDPVKDVASLEVPEPTRLKPECFSPDGARLIAFGLDNGQLYLWDLRDIRKSLAEARLDWDATPIPASERQGSSRSRNHHTD